VVFIAGDGYEEEVVIPSLIG